MIFKLSEYPSLLPLPCTPALELDPWFWVWSGLEVLGFCADFCCFFYAWAALCSSVLIALVAAPCSGAAVPLVALATACLVRAKTSDLSWLIFLRYRIFAYLVRMPSMLESSSSPPSIPPSSPMTPSLPWIPALTDTVLNCFLRAYIDCLRINLVSSSLLD